MDKLVIEGGVPLNGEVQISGAKTALCLSWRQLLWLTESTASQRASPA